MTLEEAKLVLRQDQDEDDSRIRVLIAAAEAYIEESTGLSKELQDSEPLCKAAMEFLLRHWYEPDEINFYMDRTLESLLKAIKSKYTVVDSNASASGTEGILQP